jgi:hypothetical protein
MKYFHEKEKELSPNWKALHEIIDRERKEWDETIKLCAFIYSYLFEKNNTTHNFAQFRLDSYDSNDYYLTDVSKQIYQFIYPITLKTNYDHQPLYIIDKIERVFNLCLDYLKSLNEPIVNIGKESPKLKEIILNNY